MSRRVHRGHHTPPGPEPLPEGERKRGGREGGRMRTSYKRSELDWPL